MATPEQTLPRPAAHLEATGAVAVDDARLGLGVAPQLFACSAVGLLVIAVGDALSRSTTSSSQWPFWTGLLLLFVPTMLRLLSPAVHRNERLFLVVMLGVSLYLVKVFFAPFGFTFADELAHEPNVNAILATHHLFTKTSILPVTASYPGLESITAGLAAMTGLTAFGAGVIVIGIARVVMMLALYLLFERLSGSARAAGVGAAVYTANANFVFFDAQFSYESLALPLLIAVLAGLVDRRASPSRHSWTIALVLLIGAVVATHHVTSYLLVLFLIASCVGYAALVGPRFREAPIGFALFTVLATVAWLTGVARDTISYLKPVVSQAFHSTIQTVQGQAAPRQLFTSTGYQSPVIERVIGVAAVLILLWLFAIGLRALLKNKRDDPYAIVLGLAGGGYFLTVLLRYVPAAWESANRASEFLFIGLAFVIGLVVLREPGRRRRIVTSLLGLCVGLSIAFAGGIIAGWSPTLRLSQPYLVAVGGRTIPPEGRAMASFAAAHLPDARFAASESDARFLATYAHAFAYAGKNPDVYDVLRDPNLQQWHLRLLRRLRIRYVVVDLRSRSFDNIAGYYFGVRPPFGQSDQLLGRASLQKFVHGGFSEIYDSGNIAVFKRR